jgi:aminopeptidase N
LEEQLPDHLKRTVYKETVPLPVKVMALGVADFAVNHAGDVAGIPVYSYVFPENKNKGFLDYAKAVQILPYFIKQIGPYPFEKLANVQSKTIFGGMENAGAIFYFEGSVGHKGIESLLAHEIAHQWFGDAVTEIDWRHLWLSEGFATYMTHLYLEQKYGADTLKAGMRTDRIKVLEFAKSRQTPVVDTAVHHNFMQLLNANSYEKGGWVLHMLRRQLGDSLFWKGIRQYFKDYNGRNASTDDFRNEMEKVSGQDLKGFFDEWLFNAATPDLYVHWKYDAEAKAVQLEVRQEQGSLMTFPLEYTIGHEKQVKKVMIREKVTTFSVPVAARPDTITIDPRVNLLATVRVKGE